MKKINKKWNKKWNKKGSALLLTLFLVSGIMIVAFAGSYIIVSGLRSSGLQYDSARAYFTAESGAEYSLMQARQLGFDLNASATGNLFSGTMPDDYPASFVVEYKSWVPSVILTSAGLYGATKRSVEVSF